MEATHFLAMYDYKDKYRHQYRSFLIPWIIMPFYRLDWELSAFERNCETLEVVVVWRIKPTDVPLQERLMRRKYLGIEPVLKGFKERVTEDGSIFIPQFETPYYAF